MKQATGRQRSQVGDRMSDITQEELRRAIKKHDHTARVEKSGYEGMPFRCSWHNQFALPSTGEPRSSRLFRTRRGIAKFLSYTPSW